MASKSATTAGIELQRETDTPGTYATIAEVFNISGPNESADQIEATSFDSTAKEFVPALRDGGEVTFEYRLVGEDTAQLALRADFTAGTTRNFKIKLDDATATLTTESEYAFAAIVTAVGVTFATNDVINGSCTLKVSGAVTFTARH